MGVRVMMKPRPCIPPIDTPNLMGGCNAHIVVMGVPGGWVSMRPNKDLSQTDSFFPNLVLFSLIICDRIYENQTFLLLLIVAWDAIKIDFR